jgi:alpha-glucosidase
MKDRELRDDPPAAGPPPLPIPDYLVRLDPLRSRNDPEIGLVLEAIREAAGEALLVGEVYLPTAQLGPYLDQLNLAFAFEFLHAGWSAERLRSVIAAAVELDGAAWVLSNHDFPRLATSLGEHAARVAAMVLLTLPGTAFVYQGDELGMPDGPGAEPPIDRYGRDRHRHPMQWDDSPSGGFTSGPPWLAPIDPERRNVTAQRADGNSLLCLYRRLIVLRRELGGEFAILDSEPEVLAFRRGGHVVIANLGSEPAAAPVSGRPVLATDPAAGSGEPLPPGTGVVMAVDSAAVRV